MTHNVYVYKGTENYGMKKAKNVLSYRGPYK